MELNREEMTVSSLESGEMFKSQTLVLGTSVGFPNIAIYSSYYIHYECLGFIIEYLIQSPSFHPENLVIYQKKLESVDFLNWKKYYNNLFGLNDNNWKEASDINIDNIELLFLPTDDDRGFNIEWAKKTKIISINHLLTRRLYENTSNFLNINIRYSHYLNKNNENWCFPVFNGITKKEKWSCLSNNNYLSYGYKTHVVCLGLHSQPHPVQPSMMFKNNDEIRYSVIARYVQHNYNNVVNIDSYESLNSELFFNLIKSADYILCFNFNTDHATISLSGSINMAFSFGAKLILPKEWQETLNIRSAISYDFEDGAFHLPKVTEDDLDMIFQERSEMIDHRNNVLDSSIDYHSSNVHRFST